jgi:hypothetical protein
MHYFYLSCLDCRYLELFNTDSVIVPIFFCFVCRDAQFQTICAMFVFPDNTFPLDATAFVQVAPKSWLLDRFCLTLATAKQAACALLRRSAQSCIYTVLLRCVSRRTNRLVTYPSKTYIISLERKKTQLQRLHRVFFRFCRVLQPLNKAAVSSTQLPKQERTWQIEVAGDAQSHR